MSKLVVPKKEWIPIADFLKAKEIKKDKINKKKIYNYLYLGRWWDGFVIKKSPTNRIVMGCLEDYRKWLGI